MLSAFVSLFLRVVEESFLSLGQSPRRVAILLAVFVAGLVFAFATRGVEGLSINARSLATTLSPAIFVWLVIFAVQIVRVPYQAYERQRTAKEEMAKVAADRDAAIERIRHSVDMNLPWVHNMMGVLSAFQKYARLRGPLQPASAPKFLVSFGEGSGPLAGDVTQWAVFAGVGGNGDLQNIGVRPENLDVESQRGMTANVLIVHAVRQTTAVLTLADDLGFLLPTRLAYAMPDTGTAIPEDVVWLQFGPGVRWSNDTQ